MSELSGNHYSGFLVEIKKRIRQAHYQALQAVNSALTRFYWDIGENIHQKHQSLGWGKSVVETLARDLQAESPRQNRFSAANLWLMRQFYMEYRNRPILESLVREISWAKNVAIMKRSKYDLEREFYLRAASRPIGVATYNVSAELPEAYRAELPRPNVNAGRLKIWDKREADDE